ncbi:hypothetical protein FOA52_003098 [Chlamydomonas sp. UWO 241]|nr:hypothetical protein FOA52_003098 [Chlamydomonas sp. UWO 241]
MWACFKRPRIVPAASKGPTAVIHHAVEAPPRDQSREDDGNLREVLHQTFTSATFYSNIAIAVA